MSKHKHVSAPRISWNCEDCGERHETAVPFVVPWSDLDGKYDFDYRTNRLMVPHLVCSNPS